MHTLCFLPVTTAVQGILVFRSILCTILVFWLALTTPTISIPGPVGNIINYILSSASLSTIILPVISTELVVNTFLLLGLHLQSRVYMLPWLVLNFVVACGLASGMMVSVVFFGTKEDNQKGMLRDINQVLLIISLNIFLVLEMVNMSAVVRVFIDLKEGRRRVSFSNTVEQKEISRVSTCQDSLSTEVVPSEGIPGKAYVTLELGERGGGSGLAFTFDDHNFE